MTILVKVSNGSRLYLDISKITSASYTNGKSLRLYHDNGLETEITNKDLIGAILLLLPINRVLDVNVAEGWIEE